MFDNGHSPTVPVSANGRRTAHFNEGSAAGMADFRDSPHLARLMLSRDHGGQTPGRMDMERFESLAFAVAFIATGLLTLAAQVTIV